LIGGNNACGLFEFGAIAETDEPLANAALGARGDEPEHPTTSTLAKMSNTRGDFIRHLSLMADEASESDSSMSKR
jgi:hypothetical protein